MASRRPVAFNSTEPNAARIYDVLLGGKDNFAADRLAADRLLAAFPMAALEARENRAFMLRAVRYMAGHGVRQLLDVGVGLPTGQAVHEVLHEALQGQKGAGRVLYVDNDPLVLTHARALLLGGESVGIAVLDADLAKPDELLGIPKLSETLDLAAPVGLLLGAVLPSCEDEALSAVRQLAGALPTGSYIALSHVTFDFLTSIDRERAARFQPCLTLRFRSRQEIAECLTGLELIEPAWVSTSRWQPDPRSLPDADLGDWNPLSYGLVAKIR